METLDKILLAHGAGGKLSHELVRDLFLPHFPAPALARLDDSAVVDRLAGLAGEESGPGPGRGRLALTTDSYVVKPLFFKGGDIGRLAVCGTVNDLAMVGATPLYLSAGFVIEEGLDLGILRRVVASMKASADEAIVEIVAGDTKVVEKGSADQLFVTTAGVGVVAEGVDISASNARPGDVVLISGAIGDHGIAVLSEREGLAFRTELESDVAPLNRLVSAMLKVSREIHVLRDPTRGGLVTSLNEIALQSGVTIRIRESDIPVHDGVRAACEMLGYDPLYVANEGKLIAIVAPEDAGLLLDVMRADPLGREASVIGEVTAQEGARVLLTTRIGGTRIVDMLAGEMLPRIC
jgi:hydrogenase expression/formation protein HypE